MSDQPLPADPVSGNAGAPLNLSLEPLLGGGQTALAPDREASVLNIALSGVVLRWRNAFNEITIRKADDLYACAAVNGNYYDPVPKGAELIQATLSVQFSDAAGPRTVDIVPPHTLTLQNPADAPRILRLLARRGFSAAQKLALALLLVTAACALPDASYADTLTLDDDDELVEENLHRHCERLQAGRGGNPADEPSPTEPEPMESTADNADKLSAAETGKATVKRGSRERTQRAQKGRN